MLAGDDDEPMSDYSLCSHRTRIIGARDPTPLRSNCMLQILEINPSLLKDLGLLVECSQALQQAISLDQLAVSRPARDAKVVLGGLI